MNNNSPRHYHSTIIVSACIMAAALIAGVLLFTAHENRVAPKDTKPSELAVRRQFSEQLRTALDGKPVLQGVARTLQQVDITDLRYHTKQDLILIEFSLKCDPPIDMKGSVILSDDGFRRYTAEWGMDNVKVRFLIK